MVHKIAGCPDCGRSCDVFDAPKMVYGHKLYPATCVYHGVFYRKIGEKWWKSQHLSNSSSMRGLKMANAWVVGPRWTSAPMIMVCLMQCVLSVGLRLGKPMIIHSNPSLFYTIPFYTQSAINTLNQLLLKYTQSTINLAHSIRLITQSIIIELRSLNVFISRSLNYYRATMKRIQLVLEDKEFDDYKAMRLDLKKYYPKMRSWEDFFKLVVKINRDSEPPQGEDSPVTP